MKVQTSIWKRQSDYVVCYLFYYYAAFVVVIVDTDFLLL